MPRGGSRAGAGRKAITDDKRRVQVTISITPENKAILDKLRKQGVKIGQLMDSLIGQLESTEK